jgi:hypothetical protein
MHINDARLIATVVRSTTGIIAVANREQKLSDTMSDELPALDRAAADVVSGQPGMRGIFPIDPEWELLDALEAAAGGYRAMREIRRGLRASAVPDRARRCLPFVRAVRRPEPGPLLCADARRWRAGAGDVSDLRSSQQDNRDRPGRPR